MRWSQKREEQNRMSQSRKRRWIAGLVALALVLSSLAAACTSTTTQKTPDAKAKTPEIQKLPEYKPFDTKSEKVIAEYEGGKVVEGKFHAYLNVLAFLQPQYAQGISDAKNRENFVKEYASLLFMSGKSGKLNEFVKKAEGEIKKDEPALLKFYQEQGSKAKTVDEILKEKGLTRAQLYEVLGLSSEREAYIFNNYDFIDAKLNHILISFETPDGKKRSDAEAKKIALEVKQKLEKGGDYKALAKEYSDDPGSKENAGFYSGPTDTYVPPFKEAADTLPLNKISDPVKTDFGYHVMKITERTTKKIKDAPEDKRNELAQKTFQKFLEDFKIKVL